MKDVSQPKLSSVFYTYDYEPVSLTKEIEIGHRPANLCATTQWQ